MTLKPEDVSEDVRDLNPDIFPDNERLSAAVAGDTTSMSSLEGKFSTIWGDIGGWELTPEYGFVSHRKWRFDFAHPRSYVAIELEGGVWSGGRHTRGTGFINDCIKYNTAALHGWTVFRLTDSMITEYWLGEIKDLIMARLQRKGNA